MDVDTFIRRYRPDWTRLEDATRRGARSLSGPDLDEAVRLYLRVSGHLAEAQARLPDPSVVAYLSSLVSRAHGTIYGTRSRSVAEVGRALTTRYREAIRESAPFILVAAALFLTVLVASLAWVANSPEARAGLLPPEAQEAIRRFGGRPADFGIGPGAVSTAILLNNIQVAVLAFGLGITAGVGTGWVLVHNAWFIGLLAGGFTAAGKAGPFWTLVLPHGLLELTAIFIAAGAGLRIGWALVDPGDRRRSRALAEAGVGAGVLVAGVVPAFVAAGLIEGYVTGSGLPAPAQLGIGVAAWAGYLTFLLAPARRRTPAHRRP